MKSRRGAAAAAVLAAVLLTRESRAAGCPPTTTCPVAPKTGLQPCPPDLARMIERASRNRLYEDGPPVPRLGQGCASPVSVEASFPCALVKAIVWAESTWRQFCAATCGQSGLTVISFDCGYGLSQVTSGMGGGAGFEPLRVAADPRYNLGAGMKILADKWRATPCVGDNQPTVVEHWYYATWAYNSFSWRNNPNNPDYPAYRPPYNGPGTLSRGSYPYQEIVWGLMAHPPKSSGVALWEAIAVSYPDRGRICATQGCSLASLPDPVPTHADACQTTLPDTATLVEESPENPVRARAGAQVTKSWRLENTGDRVWSTTLGYAFVRTSLESLGGPARADLASGASHRYGQTADLSLTLVNPVPGLRSATWQLQRAGQAVGPPLVAAIEASAPADADGDGHAGRDSGGDDCDDTDPRVHPGAQESCDGRDEDCDDQVDEGAACPAGEECREGACLPGPGGGDACAEGACLPGPGGGDACAEGACLPDAGGEELRVFGRCGCGTSSAPPWPALLALAAAGSVRRRVGTPRPPRADPGRKGGC